MQLHIQLTVIVLLNHKNYCMASYFPYKCKFSQISNGLTTQENLFWAAVLSSIVGHYCDIGRIWCNPIITNKL